MDGRSYTTVFTALTICVEGVCESCLLGGVDGQAVVVLDLNPSKNVGTLEGVERGEPSGGVLVALGLVEVVGDGNELGLSQVIGKLFATVSRPIAGSADPGFLQRNYMVLEDLWSGRGTSKIRGGGMTYDIEIGSQVGGDTIVRRNPVARDRGAVGIGDYVRAVPLQNSCSECGDHSVSRTPEDARVGLDQELTFSCVAFTADWELFEHTSFGRDPSARGGLTYDPGVEVVPLVWGGVGWRCDRHCDRNKVQIFEQEQRMFISTLREVGPRGRDGDANWERTTVEPGEVKGSGEGAGDESANGKYQRESDHC